MFSLSLCTFIATFGCSRLFLCVFLAARRLRHRADGIVRTSHLNENLIEPLQRSVQMNLNPAGRRCDILPMILSAPALHEAHPNRAHLRELIHSFEAMVHRLRQQLSEFLIVEDLQRAAGRNLTHGARMKAMMVIAVARLYENRRVAETLRIHLAAHIVEMHALADVPARILDRAVAIHIAQLAETEACRVVRWIRKAVDNHRCRCAVKDLAHATIQLVVGY